jgi:cellulose synthase/poly-beta-1,6-N-acetylglucosamine synthase-like glycosyltransferase
MPTTTAQHPRLSIIIPAPGDETTLEETLVSVLENRPENSEIVVVLGFGYHDPWSVGEEVRFIQAPMVRTGLHVSTWDLLLARAESYIF